MFCQHRAASGNSVALRDRVFHSNNEIRKRLAEFRMEGFKVGRSPQWTPGVIGKAVSDAIFGKHLMNGVRSTFIPNLRSEERRVGKECRSRVSTDHYRKQAEMSVLNK